MAGKRSANHIVTMLLLAGALLFGACRDTAELPIDDPRKDPPTEEAVLTAEPLTLNFDADGGTRQLAVTVKNTEWSAASDSEWLTVNENRGVVSGNASVTAQPNPTTADRQATVTLRGSNVDPVSVTIRQSAAEIPPQTEPIVMEQAAARYLGDNPQTAGLLDNLLLELSETDPAAPHYPAMSIVIDLNLPATTFADLELSGSYTANLSDTPSCGTFNSAEATRIIRHDTDGHALDPLYTVGGHVEIVRTNDLYRIDLTLKTGDGTQYTACYEGRISFIDGSSAPHSTLTEDIHPTAARATGVFSSCDDPEAAVKKLVLQFYSDLTLSPVENMMWTLHVAPAVAATGAIEGDYTVIENSGTALLPQDLRPGTIAAGQYEQTEAGEPLFIGSWYRQLTVENGKTTLTAAAPFVKGVVNISRHEGTYTINYRFIDDNPLTPHTVSGDYTGTIDFQNLGE